MSGVVSELNDVGEVSSKKMTMSFSAKNNTLIDLLA